MKESLLILLVIWNICCFGSYAQSKYYENSINWLKNSENCKPSLIYKEYYPLRLVRPIKDQMAYQGWRMEDIGKVDVLFKESLKQHSGVILDFGEHLTGMFTFSLKILGDNVVSDAPIRLKFTFAEVPSELNTPFTPYPGSLSRAWLQDEVVTLMNVPVESSISRRVSFRYLKIDVLGASSFDFAFEKIAFKAQSAVEMLQMDLAERTNPLIKRINEIGLCTLKECMQTVYEDGPKRDRRLWIGDLYLESLANTYSYKNHDLTKRCLYLLAALANDDGLLHASVFEYPKPHPQYNQYCLDYALIYNVALLEYLKATGDRQTAEDLWPVVVRQIEIALRQYASDMVYDMQKSPLYWLVFDWKDNFDRHASMQGLVIWAIENSYELAKMIGREREVNEWPVIIKKMRKSARQQFYNREKGVIVSGPDRQISYLSQVWMILSGTLSIKEGARALKTVMSIPDACYPGCPYAYHYVIEALLKCGMKTEAKNLLMDYWGGMVQKGADTFWEVYDPQDDKKSPYGFFPINSYCHAWSCTPVYFINKYPEVFQ